MQAAFQAHVENAVSKTINLAPEATPGDVAQAFFLAHRLGLRGSRCTATAQVLSLPSEPLTRSHEFGEECRLCSV